jgi:hypothetical protein
VGAVLRAGIDHDASDIRLLSGLCSMLARFFLFRGQHLLGSLR